MLPLLDKSYVVTLRSSSLSDIEPPFHEVFSFIQLIVLKTNLSISYVVEVPSKTDLISTASSVTPAFVKCESELEEFA